jgi:hypothetical protein
MLHTDDNTAAPDLSERDLKMLHAAGRLLPSELRHRKLLKWPAEAALMLGTTQGVLAARQARGDCPTLTPLGRQLFVTPAALDDWIEAHADDGAAPPTKRRNGRKQTDAADQ